MLDFYDFTSALTTVWNLVDVERPLVISEPSAAPQVLV